MKMSALLSLLIFGFSAFANSGDLISVTHLTDAPNENISYARQNFGPAEAGIAKSFGFKRYKVSFKTMNLNNEEIASTGLLMVPDTTGSFVSRAW